MTRPGLLCVPQSRNFGRTDPDPKAGLIANEPRCANTERARVCATQNARFKYEVTFVRLLGRGDLKFTLGSLDLNGLHTPTVRVL